MRTPRYVIERDLPGAGRLSPQELKGIPQQSCGVLDELGPKIQWQQSHVTDDWIYCAYIAPNGERCANTRARAESRPIASPKCA